MSKRFKSLRAISRDNPPNPAVAHLAACTELSCLGRSTGMTSLAMSTAQAFNTESAVDMARAMTPIPSKPFSPG